jgi:hypothetical protein
MVSASRASASAGASAKGGGAGEAWEGTTARRRFGLRTPCFPLPCFPPPSSGRPRHRPQHRPFRFQLRLSSAVFSAPLARLPPPDRFAPHPRCGGEVRLEQIVEPHAITPGLRAALEVAEVQLCVQVQVVHKVEPGNIAPAIPGRRVRRADHQQRVVGVDGAKLLGMRSIRSSGNESSQAGCEDVVCGRRREHRGPGRGVATSGMRVSGEPRRRRIGSAMRMRSLEAEAGR